MTTPDRRSPGLGVMWREGCPKSPDWEGDVELGSESVEQDDDGINLCMEVPRGGKGKKHDGLPSTYN